jgi:putative ABC transport system ATP-binding protein
MTQEPSTVTQTETATLASLRGISKRYQMGAGEVRALDNLTLDISRGEFLVVLGPSGSGKTTLLNLLGGIDTPTSGQLVVDSRDIATLPDAELTRYRRRVGFIFQFFNLIPTLTAVENVEFAAELVEAPRGPMEVLASVGLEGRSSAWPSPGRWSRTRRWCSAMSPRATWTRRPASASWA